MDLIKREDAIKSAVHALCDFFGYDEDGFEFPVTNTDYLVWAIRKNITAQINALPSAEEKTGKWIPGKEIAREILGGEVVHIDYRDFTCSSCRLVVKDLLYHLDGSPFYKYCPNCGAKMKPKYS